MKPHTKLEKIVQKHLRLPISKCKLSQYTFGIVVNAPNQIMKLPEGLEVKFGDEVFWCSLFLKKGYQYAISERILSLNAGATTGLHSHEKVVYEIVKVLSGAIKYIEIKNRAEKFTTYGAGKMFYSVCTTGKGLPDGFYHQLQNPLAQKSLAHIITIATLSAVHENGILRKYGLNTSLNQL